MAEYKESQITGSEYTRCNQVVISNPLGETPQIQFHESRVVKMADRHLTETQGVLQIAFDADKEVPLLNPETLEPTGQSMTMQQMYVALFSAYIQAAVARDTPPEIEEVEG